MTRETTDQLLLYIQIGFSTVTSDKTTGIVTVGMDQLEGKGPAVGKIRFGGQDPTVAMMAETKDQRLFHLQIGLSAAISDKATGIVNVGVARLEGKALVVVPAPDWIFRGHQ